MLIALMGLPSSGKTSTTRALGQRLGARVFLEPEEDQWPSLVHERQTIGFFTALTWFRSARVPDLYTAESESHGGGTTIVDCYYDKLVSLYMGEACFSWLIPAGDPYFAAARQMAETDYHRLPVADVLVFLRLDESTWLRFMERRGRRFDHEAGLARQFEMQSHLERACMHASKELGMRLIVTAQTWDSPEITASLVEERLMSSS